MSCRRCTLSWSCCPRSRAGTGSTGQDNARHPTLGTDQPRSWPGAGQRRGPGGQPPLAPPRLLCPPAEPQVTGQGCFSAAYKGQARSPSLQGHSLWLWCGSGHGCTGICPQLWHGATLGGFLGPRADGQEGDTRGGGKGRHQKPQVSYNAWEAGSTTDALTASCRHGYPEGCFLTGASPPSQGGDVTACRVPVSQVGLKLLGAQWLGQGFPAPWWAAQLQGRDSPGHSADAGNRTCTGRMTSCRPTRCVICDQTDLHKTGFSPQIPDCRHGTWNTDSWPFDSIANSACGGETLMLSVLSSAARKVRLVHLLGTGRAPPLEFSAGPRGITQSAGLRGDYWRYFWYGRQSHL